MSQQFFEGQASLRRMPPFQQFIDRGVRRRSMNVDQGLAQRGHARIGQYGGRQPILELARRGLVEREPHQLTQPPLSHALGGRIDGREVILRRPGGRRVDAAILGMDDLQTRGSAPRLAETADAHAARQAGLLLRREVEESQRQETRAVRDLA